MKLTAGQLATFERDGYLFFPGLFTADETRTLTDAVPALYARREVCNVREKGSDAVRTNFAAHLVSAPFARLARHPRHEYPVALPWKDGMPASALVMSGEPLKQAA